MATVFMRWLETTPADYDRGIRLLTLDRLPRLHQRVVDDHVQPGSAVLEVGCGTGGLTVLLARRDARVTAVDVSADMLAVARDRVRSLGLQDHVDFQQTDATTLSERFEAGSFDTVVASLVLSELVGDERATVLEACRTLLTPDGTLVVVDEVIPPGWSRRALYRAVRWPAAALTWLLTRTATHPLEGVGGLLAGAGFDLQDRADALGGSLVLVAASPGRQPTPEPHPAIERLTHAPTWRTRLEDLWCLVMRVVPPYPRRAPGLYAIGTPDRRSPVLVTGNYSLTVRRVVAVLDRRLDAWLLVADSAGVNVWCAAGGGFLTADRVMAAVRSSRLADHVDHRALVLPQLCANGVDGNRIRRESGWGVHWGPARAEDIPAYVAAGRRKTDAMRHLTFPLRARLEMVTATLGLYAVLLLVPIALLWPHLLLPTAVWLLALSATYAVVLPVLPGRDGLAKSVPLAALALGAMVLVAYAGPGSAPHVSTLFDRAVGVTALSVFVAAELQGMSPLMRGEQANWRWEAVIFGGLLVVWLAVPRLAGWR